MYYYFNCYNPDGTIYGTVMGSSGSGNYEVKNTTTGVRYTSCTYNLTPNIPVPLILQWGKYGGFNITKSKGIPVTIVLSVGFSNTMFWGQFMPIVGSGRVYYHFDSSGNSLSDLQMIPYLHNPTSSTATINALRYCCIGF